MAVYKNILQKILESKRVEIADRKLMVDELTIRDQITSAAKTRPFIDTIEAAIDKNNIAVICELKKASPSKGLLCAHYDPEKIAKEYEANGGTCLSVLTEKNFFLGSDDDLLMAKRSCNLPILRKDFIIDSYQIYESRKLGADCILLIAAALTKDQLMEFYQIAKSIDLDVLIEVNDEEELATALDTHAKFIGINNRNLKDFSVNLTRTIELASNIPADRLVVCESGIRSREDIVFMHDHKVNVFLIGETLMKADSPGEKLRALLGA